LVEQRTENPRVGGSIPPLGTIDFNGLGSHGHIRSHHQQPNSNHASDRPSDLACARRNSVAEILIFLAREPTAVQHCANARRPLMTQSGHQLYRRGIERANFISKASGSLGANIDLFGRIATLAPGKRCETLSPRVNIKERIKVCTDEFFQWRQQYYPTRRSAWLRG
jgi:hypothetical protein